MYTAEKLTLNNKNKKTAEIAEKIGSYLKKTGQIVNLEMKVDGKHYKAKGDTLSNLSSVYALCDDLKNAEKIEFFMRSCDNEGLIERLKSNFLGMLTDDPEILQNVTYKSSDYDEGTMTFLCAYDENGLRYPHEEYEDTTENILDISQWYCPAPNIALASDEVNPNLHDFFVNSLKRICTLGGCENDELDEAVSDDWEEYGEIVLEPALRFSGKDLKEIVDILKAVAEKAKQNNVEYSMELYAIPDGDNDYDFASVAIISEDGKIKAKSVKF